MAFYLGGLLCGLNEVKQARLLVQELPHSESSGKNVATSIVIYSNGDCFPPMQSRSVCSKAGRFLRS